MVEHSHESQTKIHVGCVKGSQRADVENVHVHSPGNGDDLLEEGRKIFQQLYTS